MSELKPVFDADGYPTDEFLDRIAGFTGTPHELLEDLTKAFGVYGDVGITPGDLRYRANTGYKVRMATGGWSGNESMISALQKSWFWRLWWVSSHVGGGFEFEIPSYWWDEPIPPGPQNATPNPAGDQLNEQDSSS